MYVRCTLGRFSAERGQAVAARLAELQASLSPVVRGLPGLIDYYAGVDLAERRVMSVSIWDRLDHADALAALPEGIAARDALAEAGVAWEPIVTFPVTWWVQAE